MIELDDLITAILVIPLGECQNLELEVFEVWNFGRKITFTGVHNDERFSPFEPLSPLMDIGILIA